MKKLSLLIFFVAFVLGINAQTPWILTGNAGTTSSHFIGTTDQEPLIFKTHNLERMRLVDCGTSLGIGVQDPSATLHVHYAPYLLEACGVIQPIGNQVLGNQVLQITTITTGSGKNNGFGIYSNRFKEVTLKQKEESNLYIEGAGGGLTIVPNGNIGVNTSTPQARLDVAGNVLVNSGIQTLSLGSAYHQDLSYGTSYIGFNAKRDNGNWTLVGDGANNGGGAIWGAVDGSILFASIPTAGGNNRTLNDTQIKNNIKLYLTPNGVLKAKEILVSTTGWPDYVLSKDYKLPTLSEVEQFIYENQHLPNVPAAEEIEANGVNLGEMNAILLQKIEELTLYIIQIEKRLSEVENRKGEE